MPQLDIYLGGHGATDGMVQGRAQSLTVEEAPGFFVMQPGWRAYSWVRVSPGTEPGSVGGRTDFRRGPTE